MSAQALQAARSILGCGGRLIIEMPVKLVDCGSRSGEAQTFAVALAVATTTGQDVHTKLTRTGEPGIRLFRDRRGDASWQHEHRNDACTDDSERDFLHAGDHDVEGQLRRRDDRKSDEGDGVTGQHEHVAARRTVNQRQIQTNADPQRDGEAEQLGRIHEISESGRSSLPRQSAFRGCDRQLSSASLQSAHGR